MGTLTDYLARVRRAAGRAFDGRVPALPEVGQPAPDFEVRAHDGSTVRLRDYRGTKVLLWFYPRADTPGCTIEGNALRDRMGEFDARKVRILGCSVDSVEQNKAFAEKFGYTFPLLCDTERNVGVAYGACTGVDARFADRISFVIDERGIIEARLPKVEPTTHTDDVLRLLD